MAKKIKRAPIECGACRYSFEANGNLYCELRLQYKHVLKDSGKVKKEKNDCELGRIKKEL